MKRMLSFCAVAMVLASATLIYGDIARPKSSPVDGKTVFHTGLTVVPDANRYEARLQISQETLNYLRAAVNNSALNESPLQRIAHSSTRTIIAGLFLFLSVSFAGVWLVRSGHSMSQKAVAAIVLAVAVFGAAAIITHANAGPPGYLRWANLPQALTEGRATSGGLDIEIVPDGNGMKLIVPLRNPKKPGE
jgi:hypothetical protein